jgi:hypothetical protein
VTSLVKKALEVKRCWATLFVFASEGNFPAFRGGGEEGAENDRGELHAVPIERGGLDEWLMDA